YAILMLASAVGPGAWTRLPSVPDRHGFAGSFAGVSGGGLLVAGGANFPDRRPWEGGKKVWTDAVFVLDRPAGEWRVAGRLPRPMGYGVSVTHGDSLVCVGGSNAAGHSAEAFRLTWADGKLASTPLPPLPKPVANACGTLVGGTLYVVGGLATPEAASAMNSVYAIDLSAAERRWRSLDPLPGPGRMLAVAAACGDALFVAGGVELVAGPDGKPRRRYLKDAYRLDPAKGWQRVADLPSASAAAPSPAPADAAGFYVIGGDDGSQVDAKPDGHRGFARTILRYDMKGDRWTAAGEVPAPRVTAACVQWGDGWVVPSGEERPGVRSPEVWMWTPPTDHGRKQ
ncbi:MAG TPA: hypothetical protein VF796_19480, partial [Humisphaera sp.]